MAKLSDRLVRPRGNLRADILCVGEAPGEEEDRLQKVFVGKAGRFLEKFLFRGSGIDIQEDVYLANAIPYRPYNPRTGANAKPSIAQVREYRGQIEDIIADMKPKVIVAMGNVALHSIVPIYKSKPGRDEKKSSGLTGIQKWRGKVLWHREYDCYVVPMMHPSAIMREYYDMGSEFRLMQGIADLETALKYANKKRPEMTYPTSCYIKSPKEAYDILQMVKKEKTTSLDLETEGFHPKVDPILGASFCTDSKTGYYIDWKAIHNVQKNSLLFSQLLSDPEIEFIFHNGAFDQKFLYFAGYPLPVSYFDTMISCHLCDENFSVGLKPNTWRYLNFGGYDQALDEYIRINKITNYKDIPDAILTEYGGFDAVSTRQLFDILSEKMKVEKVAPLFRKVSIPVRTVMTEAEITGFRVDTDRAHRLNTACDKAVAILTERAYTIAGREFNINSSVQVSKILFKDLGLQPLKKTKSGWSTDKETLKAVANQDGGDIAKYLHEIKYIHQKQTTFIKPVLTRFWDDGRIHTRYNTTGTDTGRTSCSDPGIHNIPRDRLIRSLYISSEGCNLVDADIKSAELRMLAAYSGDPFLITAFNEGRDLHTEVFKLMFNKSSDYVPTDEERSIAKAINFGLVYGRGPKSLAETLNIDKNTAKEYIDLYFQRLPLAKKFLTKNIKIAHQRGYVTSIFGRRRRLELINYDDYEIVSRCERQGNNSVVQSGAADYTYIGLIRVSHELHRRGLYDLQNRIVHTVHDCVIVDSPEKYNDEVKSIIIEAFEKPVSVVPVKMAIDVNIEKRWGEKNESKLYNILIDCGVVKPHQKEAS